MTDSSMHLNLSSLGKASSLISSLEDDASKLFLTQAALDGQENFRLDTVSLSVECVTTRWSQTALAALALMEDSSETNVT